MNEPKAGVFNSSALVIFGGTIVRRTCLSIGGGSGGKKACGPLTKLITGGLELSLEASIKRR